ncbi:MAG: hypothetical protein ABIT69_00970 [Sphingomicrobium sp.]
MSEHFRPDNRHRARFGQSDERWMSPADYAALSPLQKRELWARRKHERRYRPTPARYRKGYYARQRWLALAIMVGAVMLATKVYEALPTSSATASGAASVHATFIACKWGGGTNCVVDGDTIYLEGQKIRIAGIDAPETHKYDCPEELALGEQAAVRLQSLLNAGAITLSSIDRDEDVYGRKLRNVAVVARTLATHWSTKASLAPIEDSRWGGAETGSTTA